MYVVKWRMVWFRNIASRGSSKKCSFQSGAKSGTRVVGVSRLDSNLTSETSKQSPPANAADPRLVSCAILHTGLILSHSYLAREVKRKSQAKEERERAVAVAQQSPSSSHRPHTSSSNNRHPLCLPPRQRIHLYPIALPTPVSALRRQRRGHPPCMDSN